MIRPKSSLSEYTEGEFLELIKEICSAVGTEAYQDELLERFIEATGYAAASDWIYYPENGEDDSPRGVLNAVKEWRAAQGLPGFKGE
ncbi:bacteriocin immunity protein [Pseudomonas fluorescens]|uniref:bacteriocin immunity protein n=1 Tax=Pseudomonas fluorescens TaxID=294 RepID=UPI003D21B509